MKAIEIVSGIIFIVIMIWFLGSWVDVQMHNAPGDTTEPNNWNMFVLITKEV